MCLYMILQLLNSLSSVISVSIGAVCHPRGVLTTFDDPVVRNIIMGTEDIACPFVNAVTLRNICFAFYLIL